MKYFNNCTQCHSIIYNLIMNCSNCKNPSDVLSNNIIGMNAKLVTQFKLHLPNIFILKV